MIQAAEKIQVASTNSPKNLQVEIFFCLYIDYQQIDNIILFSDDIELCKRLFLQLVLYLILLFLKQVKQYVVACPPHPKSTNIFASHKHHLSRTTSSAHKPHLTHNKNPITMAPQPPNPSPQSVQSHIQQGPTLPSLLPLTAIAAIADTNTSVDPTSSLQPPPLNLLFFLNQDATSAASISAVASPSGVVLCLDGITVFLRFGAALCVVMARRLQQASGGVPISPFLDNDTASNF